MQLKRKDSERVGRWAHTNFVLFRPP